MRIDLISNSNNLAWQHKIIFPHRNSAEMEIDGNAFIVQRWRFEDDAECSADAGEEEDPEEESVQHH